MTSISLPKDIHGFGVEGPFLTTMSMASFSTDSDGISSEVDGASADSC